MSAVRKPIRCVPPSTVLMLFANENTASLYESLYWIATSIETGTVRSRCWKLRSPEIRIGGAWSGWRARDRCSTKETIPPS